MLSLGVLGTILVIVAVVAVIFWIADSIGLPGPLPWIVKGIVGIVAIVMLFNLLQGLG